MDEEKKAGVDMRRALIAMKREKKGSTSFAQARDAFNRLGERHPQMRSAVLSEGPFRNIDPTIFTPPGR